MLHNMILIVTSIIFLILYSLTGNLILNILVWAFLLSSQILTAFKMSELFKENEKLQIEKILYKNIILTTYKNMPEILSGMKDILMTISEGLDNNKCDSTTSTQP